jgi:hypothetical protein
MYRESVITFVDILGFKNLINSKTFAEVKDKLSVVRRLSGLRDKEDGEGMAPKIIQFSDSIIRIRPLDSAANKEMNYGLMFFEMLDLVHMQGELINHGVCVRGGVALGEVHFDNETLFGPGFVRAYELESVYANFPRIVVDPLLIKQISKDQRLASVHNSLEDEISSIRKVIRKDSDGIYFIDYLRSFLEEIDDSENIPLFIKNHKKTILDNAAGLSQLSSISAKYLWMANYHNQLVEELPADFLKYHGLTKKKLQVSSKEIPLLQSI